MLSSQTFCTHGNSEDESVDQILATNAVPSVALTELINKTHADSVCYPLNVDNSGGSGDDIAGDNDSPPQCNSYGSDFANCHWIDSDTDSKDTGRDEVANVVGQINEWANKCAIPHVAVTDLMQILKPYLPALPGCARTLLSTPTACIVKQLNSGGEYCHLGLAKGLQEMYLYGTAVQTKCLELQLNVDGVPLFKSSNLTLWPILCGLKMWITLDLL